ncbi:MAG TPA: hypothetical protein VMU14_10455 [Acidimicrobiales bacterium]|nr:hypothetical protein [Acidimicrobiales bacterium]
MTDVVVTTGIVGVVLALAVAPLLLPWPSQLRWVLTAEAVNPLIAASNEWHGVHVGPVVLLAVDSGPGGLAIEVRPEGGAGARALVGRPSAPGELAALEGWCHLGTTLLLVDDPHGAVLHGPDRVVTGLRETHRATTT